MIQRVLPVGPLQCNCQILVCPHTGEAALIDPGDEAQKILSEISKIEAEIKKKIQVKALLHTHAHYDHIGATRKVKEKLSEFSAHPSPSIYLHQSDLEIYNNLVNQGKIFGLKQEEPLPVDQFFQDNEILNIGKMKIEVRHTPGHSPGGVCLCLKENSEIKAPEMIFSGDTLFHENIGRADLWGGDEELLIKSIRERLYTQDGDIPVWPGHGPRTSIGHEIKYNPYT